jgi:hypothetical protein
MYRHTKLLSTGELVPYLFKVQWADGADQRRGTYQEERYNHGPSSTLIMDLVCNLMPSASRNQFFKLEVVYANFSRCLTRRFSL